MSRRLTKSQQEMLIELLKDANTVLWQYGDKLAQDTEKLLKELEEVE